MDKKEVRVFDPDKVTIIFNGYFITGFSDGSEIVAERNEDDVIPKTGIQGDTVYALNGNRSGVIRISLFNSSSSLHRLRRDAQSRVIANCTLRDANADGSVLVAHDQCVILKAPPYTVGNDAKASEISIYVPVLNFDE